ncbi:TetR/AcrR family transcriptional regulator C-terminal domain-containing protein [Streptomyces sp900105245]|uniref:TetR/AcrR family transcriptional regulator C-terminal domain-containing protein n=1 Tax=Streptomyces sp. 900105245 TaxID=3154379 RepID=UPI00331A4090
MIEPSADVPADAASPDENLNRLARRLVGTLTQPRALQLRRLITANAEAFPELGTAWYTRNVQRVRLRQPTWSGSANPPPDGHTAPASAARGPSPSDECMVRQPPRPYRTRTFHGWITT